MRVERGRLQRRVVLDGVTYDVDFLNDHTEWIFDTHAAYRVKPDPGDHFTELVNRLVSKENGES